MSDSPDAIRADIERTRRDLGGDVDALADKVNPSKIVDRQVDRVRGVFGSVRERVMGAADDAGSSLSDAASNVAGAKDRVVTKAQGSPLGVGLAAFGVGLLIASLIPPSAREKDLAATVQDQAQPLVDQVTEAAKDVGEHLKEPAQDALAAVKDSAQDSVAAVKEEAQSAAGEVKDQAQHAQENLSGN